MLCWATSRVRDVLECVAAWAYKCSQPAVRLTFRGGDGALARRTLTMSTVCSQPAPSAIQPVALLAGEGATQIAHPGERGLPGCRVPSSPLPHQCPPPSPLPLFTLLRLSQVQQADNVTGETSSLHGMQVQIDPMLVSPVVKQQGFRAVNLRERVKKQRQTATSLLNGPQMLRLDFSKGKGKKTKQKKNGRGMMWGNPPEQWLEWISNRGNAGSPPAVVGFAFPFQGFSALASRLEFFCWGSEQTEKEEQGGQSAALGNCWG